MWQYGVLGIFPPKRTKTAVALDTAGLPEGYTFFKQGYIHQWFEGNEEHYCLLNMVDDATGICLAMLDKGETTQIKREYYQIAKGYEKILNPEEFIVIKKYLDGTMRFWHNDIELSYHQLSAKPDAPSKFKVYVPLKGPVSDEMKRNIARKAKQRSPWNQYNPNWLSRKKASNDSKLANMSKIKPDD